MSIHETKGEKPKKSLRMLALSGFASLAVLAGCGENNQTVDAGVKNCSEDYVSTTSPVDPSLTYRALKRGIIRLKAESNSIDTDTQRLKDDPPRDFCQYDDSFFISPEASEAVDTLGASGIKVYPVFTPSRG